MPIQIKIKSSGADISECGPTAKEETASDSTIKPSDIKDSDPATDEKVKETPSETLNKDTTKDSPEPKETTKDTSEPKDTVKDSDEIATADPNYEYEGDEVFYTDQTTKGKYKVAV